MNETMTMGMKTVSRIAAPVQMPRLKRVAAYARVSMGKDTMLHSLAAQVSYYSDLIQRNPEWEYAGVYADMLTPTLIQMHPTCTQFAP